MGPGPSDVNPRILEAMSRPTIGHLDPAFVAMMDEMKGLLQYAFQTKNELTMPVSAPGSAGMETCFVNLVEPGDKVVVCRNGVFGMRMTENVERCGGEAILVEDEWGQPVDPAVDLAERVLPAVTGHQAPLGVPHIRFTRFALLCCLRGGTPTPRYHRFFRVAAR